MNEINYPWHLAPDWAKWAATDSNGCAFWFAKKPFSRMKSWQCDYTTFPWERVKYVQITGFCISEYINWRDSLQKRPK